VGFFLFKHIYYSPTSLNKLRRRLIIKIRYIVNKLCLVRRTADCLGFRQRRRGKTEEERK